MRFDARRGHHPTLRREARRGRAAPAHRERNCDHHRHPRVLKRQPAEGNGREVEANDAAAEEKGLSFTRAHVIRQVLSLEAREKPDWFAVLRGPRGRTSVSCSSFMPSQALFILPGGPRSAKPCERVPNRQLHGRRLCQERKPNNLRSREGSKQKMQMSHVKVCKRTGPLILQIVAMRTAVSSMPTAIVAKKKKMQRPHER